MTVNLLQASKEKLHQAHKLLHRKGREASDTFLVEGVQAVREALKLADTVQLLFIADPVKHQELVEMATPGTVNLIDKNAVARLSQTVASQGVFAVCKRSNYVLAEKSRLDAADSFTASSQVVDLANANLVVICAQVRDPGNAGTVIRCADAFGADAVVLTKGSVELENPKTVRASVGSIFHLPVVRGVELAAAVSALRSFGFQILAADFGEQKIGQLMLDGKLDKPTAWIFGNEAWGLPSDQLALADAVVSVEMWGGAESLNLSTAAAICLHQTAFAQRHKYRLGI